MNPEINILISDQQSDIENYL